LSLPLNNPADDPYVASQATYRSFQAALTAGVARGGTRSSWSAAKLAKLNSDVISDEDMRSRVFDQILLHASRGEDELALEAIGVFAGTYILPFLTQISQTITDTVIISQ